MPKRLWMFLSSLILPAVLGIVLLNQAGPEPVQPEVQVEEEPIEIHYVSTTAPAVQANAEVVRAVDGDTFVAKLDGEDGEWKIRMLGINTPESVDPRRPVECFGKEASAKLAALLSSERIRLESDPAADERDKYDRLLKNVFLEDGTDVNALMVREGYAYAYLSFPLDRQRKAELKKLEAQAKLTGAGLWATSTCAGAATK